VSVLLGEALGQRACSYTDFETGATSVTVYLPRKPPLPGPKRAWLAALLERLNGCGLNVGPAEVLVTPVRKEHWAESWKRHFQPIEINSALLIKPSWSERRPRKGQAVVVLDPGLSFGTGQHPTTAFCLQEIQSWRNGDESQSFLDLGTGSGILAIAAAKLGYTPVEAIDNDAEAVRTARANAKRNRELQRIRFLRRDVTRLPRRPIRQYSLICANLVSTLLLAERGRILARLEDAGMLVIAGVLKTEFRRVREAYEAAGLQLVATRTEKEWRSGSFTWRL